VAACATSTDSHAVLISRNRTAFEPPMLFLQFCRRNKMAWQNAALAMAGIIGAGTAVVHGILVQRYMVRPFEEFALANKRVAGSIRRMIPLLLHFSTISWFLGGLALIAAANWFERDARLAISLFVGGGYLFGAVGNLWATRGRHFGWMLMAAALVLIVLGANKPGV
jgi:hypothetical protein